MAAVEKLATLYVVACLALFGRAAAEAASSLQFVGVNFAGSAFGADRNPGRLGWDYFYPKVDEIAYFAGKGATIIRLCVLWERVQPRLRGDLAEAEMKQIDGVIAGAGARHMTVLIDIHNYAAFTGNQIGTEQVSIADFADLWRRIAGRYRGEAHVIFGLMNEPVRLPTETWLDAANAAIEAIRSVGAENLIMVPGNGWSSARDWEAATYGTPNAAVMRRINDRSDRFVFEAHQYFDADASGTHAACIDTSSAVRRLASFTAWVRKNKRKAFLGEFGVGPDQNCLDVLAAVLHFMQDNPDVWIGWSYWAAGPWAKDYFTNVGPIGGSDRPQMKVLERFMPH
jgi:endoglucanase